MEFGYGDARWLCSSKKASFACAAHDGHGDFDQEESAVENLEGIVDTAYILLVEPLHPKCHGRGSLHLSTDQARDDPMFGLVPQVGAVDQGYAGGANKNRTCDLSIISAAL